MGLFAKVVVFRATVAGGVTWLAVIMAVNTVIGLYYYLAWAARLFAPARPGVTPAAAPEPGFAVRAAVAATAAGAVVLTVAPQLVLQTVGTVS
jgi:NADH-quinone oxidoreductase subunit N